MSPSRKWKLTSRNVKNSYFFATWQILCWRVESIMEKKKKKKIRILSYLKREWSGLVIIIGKYYAKLFVFVFNKIQESIFIVFKLIIFKLIVQVIKVFFFFKKKYWSIYTCSKPLDVAIYLCNQTVRTIVQDYNNHKAWSINLIKRNNFFF